MIAKTQAIAHGANMDLGIAISMDDDSINHKWQYYWGMSRSFPVRLLARISLLGLLAFIIASCGGGGGSAPATNTVVRFSVNWGARSRALEGPGSALSLVLRITGAGVPSGDFVFTGNRDANAAAHTQNFTTTGQAKAGSHAVVATFYSEANGTGSVVGTASATMSLATDGNLSGTINTTGTIATVAVASGKTVAVGEAKIDLVFTARNGTGGIVAVAQGAAVWAVVTGADKIDFVQGRARGLAAGTPTVTASVDGHVSPAVTVTVTANPSITVSVSPPSVTLDQGQTLQFTATVTGSANQAVTWAIQEGAGGGTISGTGLYTAPNTSGEFTIVATSVADPTASGTASARVTAIPGNKIFYALGGVDTVEYRQIKSDGTGDALVASFSPNFDAIAPNPATPQFAFAYTVDPQATDPVWKLYKNTTVALAGATQLSATNFRFFGTIQFTPDGSQIVFAASVTDGEFGVYRINADGTGQTRLDDGEEADVSPDGAKIVYTKLDSASGFGEIWTMNMDGTGKTRLTTNTNEDWYPRWSKDGTKIVISSDRGDVQLDLYTMNANGSSPFRVTNSPDDEYGGSFNSAGTQLAVAVLGLNVDDTGLYRVNVDGTGRAVVKLAPNIDLSVFWSPGSGNGPNAWSGGWAGGGNPRGRRHRR